MEPHMDSTGASCISSGGSSPQGGAVSPAASARLVSRFVQPYEPASISSSGGGDPIGPPTSLRRPAAAGSKLSKWTLVALLYAGCIGSGYGFEDAVGAAGPLYCLIFCLVIPWIWSLPTGLVVAELSTSIRSNSGVLMWVNVSFPPLISFMNIVATIFIIFVGNATYPNLAAEYITKLFPSASVFQEVLAKLGIVLLCSIANIVGIEIVGKTSLFLSIFTALPFVIFTLHQFVLNGISLGALSHVPSSVNWATFLSIASWNYSNLESAGAVVEDVYNPRVNIPGAMLPLVLSTYVSYLLPTAAGASAFGPDQDWSHWKSGYWPTVAQTISGPWLQNYLSIGAVLTSFGYTVTGICCSSNMLAGLGQMEVFPRQVSQWLSRISPRFGTPVNSILLNTFVTISFSLTLSFGEVVALSQAIYCLRLALVFAAVVRLRRLHPTLHRPYAIPIRRTSTLAAVLAVPFCVSLLIACASSLHSSLVSVGVIGFICVTAVAAHFYTKRMRPFGFGGSIQYFFEGPHHLHNTSATGRDGLVSNFETTAVPPHLLPRSPNGSMIDINSNPDDDDGDEEEDTGDDPNDATGVCSIVVGTGLHCSNPSSGSSASTAVEVNVTQRVRVQELEGLQPEAMLPGMPPAALAPVVSSVLSAEGGNSSDGAVDLRHRRNGAGSSKAR